jgi:hypothetical protein
MKHILTLESHSKPYRGGIRYEEYDKLMRIDEILDIFGHALRLGGRPEKFTWGRHAATPGRLASAITRLANPPRSMDAYRMVRDIGTDPIPAPKARQVVQAMGEAMQVSLLGEADGPHGELLYVVSRPDRPDERYLITPKTGSTDKKGPLFDDSLLIHFVRAVHRAGPPIADAQDSTLTVKFLPDDYFLLGEEIKYAPDTSRRLVRLDHMDYIMCDELAGLMARLADLGSWLKSMGSASP